MKLFKKIVAGIAVLALATGVLSFGKLSLKNVAAEEKSAENNGFVLTGTAVTVDDVAIRISVFNPWVGDDERAVESMDPIEGSNKVDVTVKVSGLEESGLGSFKMWFMAWLCVSDEGDFGWYDAMNDSDNTDGFQSAVVEVAEDGEYMLTLTYDGVWAADEYNFLAVQTDIDADTWHALNGGEGDAGLLSITGVSASSIKEYPQWQYMPLDDETVAIVGCNGQVENENIVIPAEIDGKKVTKIGGMIGYDNEFGIDTYWNYARVFAKCNSLKSVTIPDGVTEIESCAFQGCAELEGINIPDSVSEIGEYTFGNCYSLKSITIPDGVTSIGDSVFCECTELESISIPDSVSEIGESTFDNCHSLKSVIIPDSVSKIGRGAFFACYSLKSVTIPDSVSEIGERTFDLCYSLTEIMGGKGIEKIGYRAFSETPWLRSRTKVKKDGVWCGSFGSVDIECVSAGDFVEDLKQEDKRGDEPEEFDYRRSYFELPDGTVWLEAASVYDLSPIDGKRISCIGDDFDAFYYYNTNSSKTELENIKDIVIPEGIEYISDYFLCAPLVNSVTCPSTLKYIDNRAFSLYESLQYDRSMTFVTLNEGLEKIGDYAFFGHGKMKSVTIPSSVKEIGEAAFGYCYYGGAGMEGKIPGFTIYGYADSAAETYAKENDFIFIEIKDEPVEKPTEAPSDAAIKVETTGELAPKLEMTKNEILSAISKLFTDEQLEAIRTGAATLDIILDVTNIDGSISENDKELIAKAVENIPGNDKFKFRVMNYLDIKLGALIGGKSFAVTETDGMITVSVAIEKPANGTYKVVRIHDGRADIIDSQLSKDGARLSFKTDKFSTYAIVYSDVAGGDKANNAAATLVIIGMLASVSMIFICKSKVVKYR